ncbi:hypothetical protein H261_03243 [Paramagnetospirillum caucaseum]|uniref:Uncharacterized protein n=1 Tax=Paramagnetospirillum caucaseum TaxID=1244869 RepID=M2YEH8_9PROT|nr:hypothetical protein [Paramagnetospirillum caucaseum]EME71391.1 hypothetical protein H261_03243 [Paramagnetospirillum caucaseum]
MPAPSWETVDDRRSLLPDGAAVAGATIACLIEAVPLSLGDGQAAGGVVPVRLLCAAEDVADLEPGDAVGPIEAVDYTVADIAPDGTGFVVITLSRAG